MNPTRKALELVEPFLEKGCWVSITTMKDRAFVEAGYEHVNFQEASVYTAVVWEDGKVVESHRRI